MFCGKEQHCEMNMEKDGYLLDYSILMTGKKNTLGIVNYTFHEAVQE